MERIPLTDEMRIELRFEIDRTGVGLSEFFRKADATPASMKPKIAEAWLYGSTKSALEENWRWLIDGYRKLPTAPPICTDLPEVTPTDPYIRASPVRPKSSFVPITEEMRSRFRSELARTGATLSSLAKICSDDIEKLTVQKLFRWKSGVTKRAAPVSWQRAMEALSNLPDARPRSKNKRRVVVEPPAKPKAPFHPWRDDYIKITPKLKEQLNFHMQRTGVGAAELLRIAQDAPDGLSADLIKNWKLGAVKSADEELIYFVLNLLKSLPDKHS